MASCGTLYIEEPFDEGGVTLSSCSLSPSAGSTIGPDETVTIEAEVQNDNSVDATVTVEFEADAQSVGSETLTVPAGGTRTASASFSASESGVISGSMPTYVNLTGISQAAVRSAAAGSSRNLGSPRLGW